jgi:septal ring factor EnvC (AmiA/AmiB activator)
MRNEERTTMTDEKTRMTKLIGKMLATMEEPPPFMQPAELSATAAALESLVTARALLGEGPATLTDVVDAAAARFDARPLHRASIEARAELAEESDQLTTLRRWIVDRDARIGELRNQLGQANAARAERDARIRQLEDRIEQLERDSNELTVRLQLAQSGPMCPGLTQEQARILRCAVVEYQAKDEDDLLAAIDANTIGGAR